LSGVSYQAASWQKKGGMETDPFYGPAEDGCFEVFRLCELATLEDSDRVDDAQTAVELSTWDVVVHALSRAVRTSA
jgi:hypothetical protein